MTPPWGTSVLVPRNVSSAPASAGRRRPSPIVLKSRATDDAGRVQPMRDEFIARHGDNPIYHYHAIQAWSVEANGEVKNVYA